MRAKLEFGPDLMPACSYQLLNTAVPLVTTDPAFPAFHIHGRFRNDVVCVKYYNDVSKQYIWDTRC
jgi:hypothetical protein